MKMRLKLKHVYKLWHDVDSLYRHKAFAVCFDITHVLVNQYVDMSIFQGSNSKMQVGF